MAKSCSVKVSNKEIRRRQIFAKDLGRKISDLIRRENEIREIVTLMLWHGSLVRARGGNKYDIDYAVFLHSDKPAELIDRATVFTKKVIDSSEKISWRRDLHYDGMTMFEAHTHWDIVEKAFSDTHIGVHFYREIAIKEILGKLDWRADRRSSSTFLSLFESWRRYCFFYRHWIYEGFALYDPHSIYKQAKRQDCLPSKWLIEELTDVARCVLAGYSYSSDGKCTVSDSKKLALDIVATLAYALEGKPIGHRMRYSSDLEEFKNKYARLLLQAVSEDNLICAAKEVASRC